MIMSIRLKDSTVSDFNIKEYIIRSFQAQVSVSQEMTAKKHRIMLPDDIEQIPDAKVLSDNKSLREVWSTSDENDLSPDFY